MKEDVGIVITNNYNIAVNLEYCLLLDTIPAENINTVNETRVITYLINNLLSYLKTESKQE